MVHPQEQERALLSTRPAWRLLDVTASDESEICRQSSRSNIQLNCMLHRFLGTFMQTVSTSFHAVHYGAPLCKSNDRNRKHRLCNSSHISYLYHSSDQLKALFSYLRVFQASIHCSTKHDTGGKVNTYSAIVHFTR